MIRLIAGSLILLVAIGCGKSGKIDAVPEGSGTVKPAPPPPVRGDSHEPIRNLAGSDQVFLTVGDNRFSRNDVALREQVIRFKYGSVDDITVKAASQLISGYLFASVLEAMGKPITYRALDEEVARIDRSTRAPEDLKKIKALFEGSKGGMKYAMIFVLPDFANRKFNFQVFPAEKRLQQDRLKLAQSGLKYLASQEKPDFGAYAKKGNGWKRDEVLFDRVEGFRMKNLPGPPNRPKPPVTVPPLPEGDKSRWARMDDELLGKTGRGKIVDQVVELDSAFLIMRWTAWHDEKKKVRMVERLILPKLAPHEYFQERIGKVGVKFSDPTMAGKFKSAISWSGDLHWLK